MSKNNYPSTLELAEMLRDGSRAVIACMTVWNRRVPSHYVRGYVCVVCEVELYLSPAAVEQVAIGGMPACCECGIMLAEFAKANGADPLVCLSPDAEEALARGNTVMDPARIERLRKDGGA